MKKIVSIILALSFGILVTAQTKITIMENVTFFDRQQPFVIMTPAPADDIIRHDNFLSAKKLTNEQIALIENDLQLNVYVKSICDNFDRTGNVFLAFVPSGSETYDVDNVEHIELGRFITPFMRKDVEPDTVSYTFNIDNIADIIKDPKISSQYDFWIELAIKGVPSYSEAVGAGCSQRNETFLGGVEFVTTPQWRRKGDEVVLKKLFFDQAFNDYQAGASDEIGKTVKTITFDVSEDIANANLYLITSNHGSRPAGVAEEYNRRMHYVSFDGEEVLKYKPGRETCEPFRKYNTQSNNIYSSVPRSPKAWQSFSNWCPGDKIDIRKIDLGLLKTGEHTFKIEVPEAVFEQNIGNFPLSLYLQGVTSDPLSVNDNGLNNSVSIYPNPSNGEFTVSLSIENAELIITDIAGKVILEKQINKKIQNIGIETNGIYFVTIQTEEGRTTEKVIISN